MLLSAALLLQGSSLSNARAGFTDEWTSYQNDNIRSGYQGAEAAITQANVSHLQLKWSQLSGGSVSVQPTVANGMVYWGSWDGYEHGFTTSGKHVWDTRLGQNTASGCDPQTAGAASSATYGMAASTAAIFVGGGGNANGGDGSATFYALNALTGSVIWQTDLGAAPAHYFWSSPALYNGSIYVGMSSFGDCPLIQGQLYKLDAATGNLQATFNAVPDGCIGASIWGSPTITSDGKIYVATGNPGKCSSSEPYAYAVIELRATDLSVLDSWQVPPSQLGTDSDFGSTPVLFSLHDDHYVGVTNKNGIFYTFKQDHLSAGPVWQTQVADSLNGEGGEMSPAAWGGSTLYVSGGIVSNINGRYCNGSVNALNPADGSFIWRHCLNDGDRVLGPTVALPGVVIVGSGTTITMVNASDGGTLFTYKDTHSGSKFWSGATISEGMIFQGNQDGYLFAFAPPS